MTESDKMPFEMVMFYNVENLFLPDPKPMHHRDPTFSGLRNWDERKYTGKLHKIAHVFNLIADEKNQLPMLVGLSEIQGEKPLQDLIDLPPLKDKYAIVHYESMDERGVDVALLYDKSKIEILSSEPISFVFEIEDDNPENYDTTRDILHCRVKFKDSIINVFVFHLPSKREHDVNRPKRIYIVNEIKERISKILESPDEAVILCGDFNENPDDENLNKLLYDDKFNKILNNPYLDIYNNKIFSTFHYKDGLLFDQIIFSNHFLEENFSLLYNSAVVFKPEKISNWDKKFLGRPFRTYAGTRYLGGYSDHFPVIVEFVINY